MSSTARAAVLAAVREIHSIELAVPECPTGSAVLQVEACAVCGSDVEAFVDGLVDGRSTDDGPILLGHEFVGRIASIDPAAAARWGVEVGDRVVAERAIPCGACADCAAGSYQVCKRPYDGSGLIRYGSNHLSVDHGLWGGFATHLVLHPQSRVYPVDPSCDPGALTFFTPLSNGLSWLAEAAGRVSGATVLIQGPGPLGLACVIAARRAGAAQILVTGLEVDADRLAIARALGATESITIRPGQMDAGTEAILDATHGRGVDVVIDVATTQSPAPLTLAARVGADQARIVIASEHRSDATALSGFDASRFWERRMSMVGVRSRSRWAVLEALRLLGEGEAAVGRLPMERIGLGGIGGVLTALADPATSAPAHVVVIPGSRD